MVLLFVYDSNHQWTNSIDSRNRLDDLGEKCADYRIDNIRLKPENHLQNWTIKTGEMLHHCFKLMNRPLEMSVQAPIKLTTFRCVPKWIIIFNSPTRDSSAAASAVDRTILTATVVIGSSGFKPIASALTTRPNAPDPNSLPVCKMKLIYVQIVMIFLRNLSKFA